MALSFALAKEGFTDGTLETTAGVKLEKDGDGFRVSRSDLSLEARMTGIDADRFAAIAEGAKADCPISKILNAEIQLEHRLNGCRTERKSVVEGKELAVGVNPGGRGT